MQCSLKLKKFRELVENVHIVMFTWNLFKNTLWYTFLRTRINLKKSSTFIQNIKLQNVCVFKTFQLCKKIHTRAPQISRVVLHSWIKTHLTKKNVEQDKIWRLKVLLKAFSTRGNNRRARVKKSSELTSMTWAAGWGPRPGWGCWGAASTQWRAAGWPAAGGSSSHCASHSATVCTGHPGLSGR